MVCYILFFLLISVLRVELFSIQWAVLDLVVDDRLKGGLGSQYYSCYRLLLNILFLRVVLEITVQQAICNIQQQQQGRARRHERVTRTSKSRRATRRRLG